MGIRGNDRFELATLKDLHILFHQELKKTFLSHATDLMSWILFPGPENSKINFRHVKALDDGRGNALDPGIVRSIAIYKVEYIHLITLF